MESFRSTYRWPPYLTMPRRQSVPAPSPISRRARRGHDPTMGHFLALWFVLGARHRCWPVWPGRMDRSGSDGARHDRAIRIYRKGDRAPQLDQQRTLGSARLQHDSAGDVRQMRLRPRIPIALHGGSCTVSRIDHVDGRSTIDQSPRHRPDAN